MADAGGAKGAQRLFVDAASAKPARSDGPQKQGMATAVDPAVRTQAMAAGCPVVGSNAGAPPAAGGGCPVVGVNPSNQMPQSPNEPLPGQSKPLSTWRQQSTIPTGEAGALPRHQAEALGEGRWVYPSEQMFYNAMLRKGWQPTEDDMTSVVAIHNAVNERAWREILHWEAAAGGAAECGGPRLVKFRGRPQDYSPKARLLNLLGYRLPFDRHDWVVDRCGEQVRYVIDFYNAAPQPDGPVAMHLDVRPALDSVGSLWARLRMQMGWISSGRWQRE